MAGDLFPLIHNIFTANILEKWGEGGNGGWGGHSQNI